MFVSEVSEPWIYQTDTKALVKALADTLPSNVTFTPKTVFLGVDDASNPTAARIRTQGHDEELLPMQFLVGADGGHSKVAASIPALSQNTRFLFGYEHVFFGDVLRGHRPHETIYHYWFGEFSLGYGGWLSPTIVNGRKAFRIGLAKLMRDRGDAKALMETFVQKLVARGDIRIDGDVDGPGYIFGSHIPIGGTRNVITHNNTLLIGDAAGFCGAFAADGIKGSVVSGKEAAILIPQFLRGKPDALKQLRARIDTHGGLMGYYRRQLGYRWIWDVMRRDRTFTAMYNIIAAEHETFLEQFCDSKDKHRSLARTVLKWKHLFRLLTYSVFWAIDAITYVAKQE